MDPVESGIRYEPEGEGQDRLLWKFDMHVHSTYSGDSEICCADIAKSYRQTGVLPLVCDHNRTAGSEVVYHELRAEDTELPLIVAEEIMTAEGEIIGLFLSEMVPPYLSAAETLDIIREQGALSIVPHPFCSFRSTSALWEGTLREVAGRVDIIEGFNARTIRERDNLRAREFAAEHKKPVSVGSDAHLQENLGRFFIELEPFFSPKDLLASLRAATVRLPVLRR